MSIEIILKGHITANGELEIQNIKKVESNNNDFEQDYKYNKKVRIKIYTSEVDLRLKDIMKLESEEIITNLDIYVKIEEKGKVVFTIEEQYLQEYCKYYRNKYIVILVEIIENE